MRMQYFCCDTTFTVLFRVLSPFGERHNAHSGSTTSRFDRGHHLLEEAAEYLKLLFAFGL
jgi:hypothetical protein